MPAYVCDFAACDFEATAEVTFAWSACMHPVPSAVTAWVCDRHPAEAPRPTPCRECGVVSPVRQLFVNL